jgi:hypothetical protein
MSKLVQLWIGTFCDGGIICFAVTLINLIVTFSFEGNTQGKAAVFGLLHGAGLNLPGSPGSLFLSVAQRFGHIIGTVGRAFSKEEEIPSWWTSKSRGAELSDN